MKKHNRERILSSSKVALLLFFLLFSSALALKLHGFSIGQWDQLFPDKESGYSFHSIGTSRALRSDEFMVSLPLVQAQCQSPDFFPAFNSRCFSTPNDMFVMTPPCPVWDWTVPGQLSNWGYFIFGFERGMSWSWLSRFLLLPLLAFLFFRICKGSVLHSIVAAIAITLGAPTQWWSTTLPYQLTFLFGSLVAAWHTFMSRKLIFAVFPCTALFVFLCSFFFSFYPPFQYPLMLCGISLLFLMPWQNRPEKLPPVMEERHTLSVRTKWLLLSLLISACLFELFYFFSIHGDTLQTIALSTYPGNRTSQGGPFATGVLLSIYKFVALFDSFYLPNDTNSCTCAMYFVPMVPLCALCIFATIHSRMQFSKRILPLLLCCLALLFWTFFTWPRFVGKISGFRIIPTERAAVILTFILEIAMFMLFAHCHRKKLRLGITWSLSIVGLGLILSLYLGYSQPAIRSFFSIACAKWHWSFISIGLFLYAILGYGLLRNIQYFFYPACIAIACLSGLFVNPVCQGIGPITSKHIVTIAKNIETRHGPGLWFANSAYLSNYLVGHGLQCLSGVHNHAHPEIWLTVDPFLAYEKLWFRYAHIEGIVSDFKCSKPKRVNEAKVFWYLNAQDAIHLGIKYVAIVSAKAPTSPPLWMSLVGHCSNIWIYMLNHELISHLPLSLPPMDTRSGGIVFSKPATDADIPQVLLPQGLAIYGVDAEINSDSSISATLFYQIKKRKRPCVTASIGILEKGDIIYEMPCVSLGYPPLLKNRTKESPIWGIKISGRIPENLHPCALNNLALIFRDEETGKRLWCESARGNSIPYFPLGNGTRSTTPFDIEH